MVYKELTFQKQSRKPQSFHEVFFDRHGPDTSVPNDLSLIERTKPEEFTVIVPASVTPSWVVPIILQIAVFIPGKLKRGVRGVAQMKPHGDVFA